MQEASQWTETKVAQLDHAMKWGGALSSFSDGSLLVRTRIDANRRDGILMWTRERDMLKSSSAPPLERSVPCPSRGIGCWWRPRGPHTRCFGTP